MKLTTHDTTVFIVHLWPGDPPPAGFRAAVRRVDRDDAQVFTQTAALAEYFRRQAASTGECDDAAADPAPGPQRD